MALRANLLKASSCTFDTEITADYGDALYSFSMSCEADAQGSVAFTVTAPQTISGITGEISGDGGRLTFDDTALQFDLMADGQVTVFGTPEEVIRDEVLTGIFGTPVKVLQTEDGPLASYF